jgi:hypothetical protein
LLASQCQFGAIQGDRFCDGTRTKRFGVAQVNQHGNLLEPVAQGPWDQFHNSATGLGNQAFIGSSAYSIALIESNGITWSPYQHPQDRARPCGDNGAAIGSAELTEP